MIHITALNGKKYHLNALYIEKVEALPDTTITLTNGDRYIVAEKQEDIVHSITRFYQSVNVLGLHNGQEGKKNEK